MDKRLFTKEGLRQWYMPLATTLVYHAPNFFPLTPFRPASGNIMITHNCNSRCLMCQMWKNRSTFELTTDEMCDILNRLKQVGIRHICFSGGEPLLRRDLPELVEETHELGFETTNIITNGLLLNKNRAQQLLDSGLNRILDFNRWD